MINSFRRFFQSKIGLGITLAFLAVIGFAFASMDVSSSGTFGGLSGTSNVAVVGDERVGTGDLSQAATNALDQVRQNNPTIAMPSFIAEGGLEQVLESVIDRTAIAEFARKYGLRAGTNLVNSEIRRIPAFRGPDGSFSEDAYRGALGQQGLSDAMVRDDLSRGLLAQQVMVPTTFGTQLPDKLASRYAALFKERRTGSLGLIPSALFAPEKDPTAAELQAFYRGNRSDYIRPERRVLRYASFDTDALGDRAEPTEQELRARYNENRAQYAASEERSFSQVIVPTQQAANAIRNRVTGGESLAAAAREAGLEPAAIGPVARADFASQTSPAVAQAAFETQEGRIATPARSGLGWHVVQVTDVTAIGGRSFEQARSEIQTALREEKRRRVVNELAASIEERLSDGESLADIAGELDIEIATSRPLTAAGLVYGTPDQQAPDILRPVLPTAFQMEEGEPQLAEVEAGETFLLFETSTITESATAPLSEIEDEVTAAWKLARGAVAARAAADRILDRIEGGQSVVEAFAAEETRLPRPDALALTREELLQNRQRVIPPLALFFSMAEGSTKQLEAENDNGWFIVDLDDIEAGLIASDDPLFAQAKAQFSQTLSDEYSRQFVAAMRADVGVETNDEAIAAVRRALVGEN
ncbi:SurA N-terminal domain-containing protein [Altererythrobacter sp. MTPC7]|uniref:peptidylprolyl isomerase n=1 Tax=Altererythrobacter sp. MTPC7 TaxID=3056567 RepID=UPI0036F22407